MFFKKLWARGVWCWENFKGVPYFGFWSIFINKFFKTFKTFLTDSKWRVQFLNFFYWTHSCLSYVILVKTSFVFFISNQETPKMKVVGLLAIIVWNYHLSFIKRQIFFIIFIHFQFCWFFFANHIFIFRMSIFVILNYKLYFNGIITFLLHKKI